MLILEIQTAGSSLITLRCQQQVILAQLTFHKGDTGAIFTETSCNAVTYIVGV